MGQKEGEESSRQFWKKRRLARGGRLFLSAQKKEFTGVRARKQCTLSMPRSIESTPPHCWFRIEIIPAATGLSRSAPVWGGGFPVKVGVAGGSHPTDALFQRQPSGVGRQCRLQLLHLCLCVHRGSPHRVVVNNRWQMDCIIRVLTTQEGFPHGTPEVRDSLARVGGWGRGGGIGCVPCSRIRCAACCSVASRCSTAEVSSSSLASSAAFSASACRLSVNAGRVGVAAPPNIGMGDSQRQ